MGRGENPQRSEPAGPADAPSQETPEDIKAVFEERGMPEGEAGQRAQDAAERVEKSKRTGKRLDAKPARKSRARTPSAGAKSSGPIRDADEMAKEEEKPVMDIKYSPAAPYRKKKSK